jgi:hypothetical protein
MAAAAAPTTPQSACVPLHTHTHTQRERDIHRPLLPRLRPHRQGCPCMQTHTRTFLAELVVAGWGKMAAVVATALIVGQPGAEGGRNRRVLFKHRLATAHCLIPLPKERQTHTRTY